MTRNQQRAVLLARNVAAGLLDPTDLTDGDWNLLLLAADLNNPLSLPLLVSRRVLSQADRQTGYFSPAGTGGRLRSMSFPTVHALAMARPVPGVAAQSA